MTIISDYRQRFFIDNSPVRGDVVQLQQSFDEVVSKKPYPSAIKALLGEMMVSASLLMGTVKINGRLSIQLQSTNTALRWAMAECNHLGFVRALADFEDDEIWMTAQSSQEAFACADGVLFISIHPDKGESYQGIVERISDDLGECLAHYQKQSAQIPTLIQLVCGDDTAAGLLVQLLPKTANDDGDGDADLWDRLNALTATLKDEELLNLPAEEILYRLYHEENVVLPPPTALQFACTCSQEKSASAIIQIGKEEAVRAVDAQDGYLTLDCGFCGEHYRFDQKAIDALFASNVAYTR